MLETAKQTGKEAEIVGWLIHWTNHSYCWSGGPPYSLDFFPVLYSTLLYTPFFAIYCFKTASFSISVMIFSLRVSLLRNLRYCCCWKVERRRRGREIRGQCESWWDIGSWLIDIDRYWGIDHLLSLKGGFLDLGLSNFLLFQSFVGSWFFFFPGFVWNLSSLSIKGGFSWLGSFSFLLPLLCWKIFFLGLGWNFKIYCFSFKEGLLLD